MTILRLAVVLLTFSCALSAQSVSELSASKDSLGKKGRTELRFSVTGDKPTDWELQCTGVELAGWRSPQLVRVTQRDPATNAIVAVKGEQFQPGAEVRIEARRPEAAKKGGSGTCRVATPAAENVAPTERTVTLQFK